MTLADTTATATASNDAVAGGVPVPPPAPAVAAPPAGVRLLNKRQMARVLSMSAPTFDRMIAEFNLPVAVQGGKGRDYGFDPDAVIAWRDDRLAILKLRAVEHRQYAKDRRLALSREGLEEMPAALRRLGVRYVLVHKTELPPSEWQRVTRWLERGPLRKVYQGTQLRAYEVVSETPSSERETHVPDALRR